MTILPLLYLINEAIALHFIGPQNRYKNYMFSVQHACTIKDVWLDSRGKNLLGFLVLVTAH